jgi:hypothetical protein
MGLDFTSGSVIPQCFGFESWGNSENLEESNSGIQSWLHCAIGWGAERKTCLQLGELDAFELEFLSQTEM